MQGRSFSGSGIVVACGRISKSHKTIRDNGWIPLPRDRNFPRISRPDNRERKLMFPLADFQFKEYPHNLMLEVGAYSVLLPIKKENKRCWRQQLSQHPKLLLSPDPAGLCGTMELSICRSTRCQRRESVTRRTAREHVLMHSRQSMWPRRSPFKNHFLQHLWQPTSMNTRAALSYALPWVGKVDNWSQTAGHHGT